MSEPKTFTCGPCQQSWQSLDLLLAHIEWCGSPKSDPNPWPQLRLIGPWKRRTGVPSRWLGRWGRDGTQSEWEDA